MELYKLNELDKPEEQPKEVYQNSMSHLSSSAIFIKAIEKTIERVKAAGDYLNKVEIKDDGKLAERSREDCKLILKFIEELDAAAKIIEEFQRATSVLQDDDSPDLIKLYTDLNQGFYYVKLHINMFSITKNVSYYDSIIALLEKLLYIFQEMDKKLQEEVSQ